MKTVFLKSYNDKKSFKIFESFGAEARVIEDLERTDDTESFRTKGDANEIEDGGSVAYDKVVGKVVLNVPYLGYILR